MRQKLMRVLAVLGFVLGIALVATPANAAKGTTEWYNEIAATVSINGVVTNYTQAQVSSFEFRTTKGVTAPAVTYWNCQNGIGCMWQHINGGGWTELISVGGYGTNHCTQLSFLHSSAASAASADYGGGWDLKMFDSTSCNGVTWLAVYSSHAVNFTGPIAFFNDLADSHMITQAGP